MKKYFIYLLISILLLYLNLTPVTRDVRGVVAKVYTPISYFTVNLYSGITEFVNLVGNLSKIQDENKHLKDKVSELQSQIVALQEVAGDQEFMENELKINSDNNFVLANVIGKKEVDNYVYLTLNVGSNKGVKKGLSAVHNGYLVGYIDSVSSNTSMLLSNSKNFIEVPVEVLRTGSSGVYTCIEESCVVNNILTSDKIEKGDIIITSGINGDFPRGLILGEVLKIEQQHEELFKSAYLVDLIDVEKISRVGVILDDLD